jgi:uncharacterized small protein (DUF1192 family)
VRHRTTSRKPAKPRGQKAAKAKRFNPPRAASSQKLSVAKLQEQVSTLTNELARRNAEHTKTLAQQTATADVLKVISRSSFDLQSVLNTLLESAVRLCEADSAFLDRLDGPVAEHVASYGLTPEVREHFFRAGGFKAGRGSVTGRALSARGAVVALTRKVACIEDVLAEKVATLRSSNSRNSHQIQCRP